MTAAIGLDIGGANIKAALSDGQCRSRPFPLWKNPDQLADVLREMLADWLPCSAVGVTMTGELADCFATKAEGVDRILAAVESTVGTIPLGVWQTSGEFVDPEIAREFPLLTAAANWHAQATFLGMLAPQGRALLIDIGSTTTDLIPLEDGIPMPVGRTDGERLLSGELVYCGVRRTPICALVSELTRESGTQRVAAELFATTHDVFLLLGQLPEEPERTDTANGRPATIDAAYDRLVRCVCSDRTEITFDAAVTLAREIKAAQKLRITTAIDQVASQASDPFSTVLLTGSGVFLAAEIAAEHPALRGVPQTRLDAALSPDVCEAACAFSLARLALDRLM